MYFCAPQYGGEVMTASTFPSKFFLSQNVTIESTEFAIPWKFAFNNFEASILAILPSTISSKTLRTFILFNLLKRFAVLARKTCPSEYCSSFKRTGTDKRGSAKLTFRTRVENDRRKNLRTLRTEILRIASKIHWSCLCTCL